MIFLKNKGKYCLWCYYFENWEASFLQLMLAFEGGGENYEPRSH